MSPIRRSPRPLRKTPRIVELEASHGRAITELIVEAIEAEGSIRGAARRLDVDQATLYYWMVRLGISVTKVVAVAS